MSVSAGVLQTHLAYTKWASSKLIDIAAQLPEEQLTRDFQTADRSVLGTLVHTFQGDRIWWARVTNSPLAGFRLDSDYQLSTIQNDWPALLDRWQEVGASLTDENAQRIVEYTRLNGAQFSQPLWEIILHVVNHGTHHRGQVSGFLRAMGHTPPPLDLLYFQLERAAHA